MSDLQARVQAAADQHPQEAEYWIRWNAAARERAAERAKVLA